MRNACPLSDHIIILTLVHGPLIHYHSNLTDFPNRDTGFNLLAIGT